MYIFGGEFRPHFTPWIGHWKSKLKNLFRNFSVTVTIDYLETIFRK